MDEVFDLAVVGGGVNGCGIARDAAGRGLKVYLCEMNDLASATSSASTKLIHGGLRYLEYYEFRLVHEALVEREVVWRMAPHIVSPLRFVLPHHSGLRPAWLLRLGLFLYDHLGGRKLLPATSVLDLRRDPAGAPLTPGRFARGFEYSDCRVDDSRLVVLNARDAADRGAVIETRTKAVAATRGADGWRLTVESRETGVRREVRARAVVNAAGPWVSSVLGETLNAASKSRVRLVQGSHIVVPRLYDHDRCYIFQNTDGRITFAIPYAGEFTLIGTTDRDFRGDPATVEASEAEIAYLCEAANGYFKTRIGRGDVVWSYSGVRPLYDDGASEAKAATRDYVLELDETVAGAPLLSIFGGKITTYRRLAETVLARLAGHLPAAGKSWTATSTLPGGDLAVDGIDQLIDDLCTAHPFLDAKTAQRLATSYGTVARTILGSAMRREDLGRDFGAGISEAEIVHLMDREWAVDAADVLWRRSKLGLVATPDMVAAIDAFMARRRDMADAV